MKEWEESKEIMFKNLKSDDITEDEKESIKQQLEAIYGKSNVKEVDELPSELKKIFDKGENPKIQESNDHEIISKIIKPYVSSRGVNKPNFWPLVKRCRLFGPFEILENGLILVDVPGILFIK
jgi:hypothetical protein